MTSMADPASPLVADAGPRTILDPDLGPVEIPAGANPFIPKPAGDKPPRGNSQANPANPPAPKPKTRRARKAAPVSDAKIREVLTDALQTPAVAYSMVRMDWPANHVLRTAPELADSMVAFSKTNEWLREQLEKLARGDNAMGMMIAAFALGTAAVAYVVPLLAYHNLIPKEIGEKVAGVAIPEMQGHMGMPEPPPHFVMPDDFRPPSEPGYNANGLS